MYMGDECMKSDRVILKHLELLNITIWNKLFIREEYELPTKSVVRSIVRLSRMSS